MKHLKLFQTEAEYTAYKNSDDFILPNVSYTVDSNIKIYYNPRETKLVCTYNVTDTTNSTKLCNNASNFTSMEVDGVLYNSIATGYTFDTTGEHTIKFELVDPTSISNGIFNGCSSLTSITIPDSVITIGYSALSNCSSLTSITIPDSVTTINSGAFAGCTNLTTVTIGNSVTSINSGVFSGCTNLTTVTIGNSVTSIAAGTFYGCSKLTTVTIPDSVTSIGSSAFQGCTSLPVIDDIRYADTYLVEATDKTLTTYNIKEGTKFIGTNAFIDCTNLTSITIPDSVTSIGDSAFYGCTSLSSITIPDSVTSIGGSAFYGCTSLSSITIPDSVTSVGSSAFQNCSSLNEITCLATTAPSIQSGTFSGVKECGILKILDGSDYSSWVGIGKYYLGYYNWTIEYIYNPLVGSYRMVNLGLPSGLKWADRNVGAASPEDAGLYFQWADTTGYTADQVGTDKVFNPDSYFDSTDGGSTFNKYNNESGLIMLEAVDDAATVNMGSEYRMPTIDELKELTQNTTITFIDLDGNEYIWPDSQITQLNLKGIKLTSKVNINSIFIPASGYCTNSNLSDVHSSGDLWSSSFFSLNSSQSHDPYYFDFYCPNGISFGPGARYFGRPVRGVCN